MMSERFEVTLVDHQWPDLKLILNVGGSVIEERVQYDIAQTKFEVTVQNALRRSVQRLIQSHKRS